jgi:hypothetical protein
VVLEPCLRHLFVIDQTCKIHALPSQPASQQRKRE